MIISSKDNPKIKYAKKLLDSSSFRKKEGKILIEGLRLCVDAAQNGVPIDTLFFTADFVRKFADQAAFLRSKSAESFEVTRQVLSKISDTDSCQGAVCVCGMPRLCLELKRGGRYLVLENVSDPSNVGAAARTAEALGTDGIMVCGGCDPFGPKVLRASMGALLRFPVEIFPDIHSVAQKLKESGIPLYCSVVSMADCTVREMDFKKGCAVLIGNEACGASPEAKNISDRLFTIPMSGRAESLNAAAAAAIIIYEMTKG